MPPRASRSKSRDPPITRIYGGVSQTIAVVVLSAPCDPLLFPNLLVVQEYLTVCKIGIFLD
jgi:hypothetical protein